MKYPLLVLLLLFASQAFTQTADSQTGSNQAIISKFNTVCPDAHLVSASLIHYASDGSWVLGIIQAGNKQESGSTSETDLLSALFKHFQQCKKPN